MRKSHIHRRTLFRLGTVALLLVFLMALAMFLMKLWEMKRGRFPEETIATTTLKYEGAEYTLKKNIETFLVMGLDKLDGTVTNDSYNNDQQADFLLLVIFDKDAKTSTALQINRDTMAKMDVLGVAGQKVNTVTKQIALSHTYGNGKEVSCRNTAEAVSGVLRGMKVNHYISVTMDAVPLYNDLLGGVEVTVNDDFTGIDETLVKGKKVKLMGQQAMTYVRTRYGLEDSSNSTRMVRQRQYVDALYEATKNRIESDESFVVDASLKLADYIVSDRSVTQLQELMRKLTEYEYKGIVSLKGESKKGERYMEFYPDEDALTETLVELFYQPVK